MSIHRVEEELVYFDPGDRLSWQEGGVWPHSNHCGFVEAIAAAYFVKRGYHVLREFCTTKREVGRSGSLLRHSTHLMHDVVGEEVSSFLCSELVTRNRNGSGEPDLFVFREDHPNDPKIHYADPRPWFFVEVKGPGDSVRDNQKTWWSEFADRFGSDQIRLVRVAPIGEVIEPATIEYGAI